MIGFGPRKLHPNGGYWNIEPVRFGHYNTLFATKGAFLHKRFYHLYFDDSLAHLRNLVDNNITAEDILMSLIWAREMNQNPIAVELPTENRRVYWDCGHKLSAHFREKEIIRKQITLQMYEHFGYPFIEDRRGFFNLTTDSWDWNHTGVFI